MSASIKVEQQLRIFNIPGRSNPTGGITDEQMQKFVLAKMMEMARCKQSDVSVVSYQKEQKGGDKMVAEVRFKEKYYADKVSAIFKSFMSKEKGLLKHIKAYDSNTLNGNLKLMTEIPTYMDVNMFYDVMRTGGVIHTAEIIHKKDLDDRRMGLVLYRSPEAILVALKRDFVRVKDPLGLRSCHKMGGDEYEEFQKVMKNHKEYVIFDVKHEKEMHDLGYVYFRMGSYEDVDKLIACYRQDGSQVWQRAAAFREGNDKLKYMTNVGGIKLVPELTQGGRGPGPNAVRTAGDELHYDGDLEVHDAPLPHPVQDPRQVPGSKRARTRAQQERQTELHGTGGYRPPRRSTSAEADIGSGRVKRNRLDSGVKGGEGQGHEGEGHKHEGEGAGERLGDGNAVAVDAFGKGEAGAGAGDEGEGGM